MDKQQRPKFSPEMRERAVRMVSEHRGDHASQWAAIVSVAATSARRPRTAFRQGTAERNGPSAGELLADTRAERLRSLVGPTPDVVLVRSRPLIERASKISRVGAYNPMLSDKGTQTRVAASGRRSLVSTLTSRLDLDKVMPTAPVTFGS